MKLNVGRLPQIRTSENKLELVESTNFAGQEVNLYKGNEDEVYMTIDQLSGALEYAGKSAIENMLTRNEYLRTQEFSSTHDVWVDGKLRSTRLFTEDGIYEVTMLSRQPKAQEFRFFIRELLKGLRKGELKVIQSSYQIDDPIERAKQWIREEEVRQQLLLENEELKPLANYAESITEVGEEILIGELAKILKQNGYNTGQNRLFQQLREEGFLQSRKGDMYNIPTQRSMDMGLFRIIKRTIDKNNATFISNTVKVTPKGQVYFINKYCGDSNEC